MIDAVQAGDIDRVVLAAQHFQFAAPERMDAAVPAEQMVRDLAAKLVIAQVLGAGQQAEGIRLDDRAPVTGLAADRAIAAAGAGRQIDVGL